jgi:fucose permease
VVSGLLRIVNWRWVFLLFVIPGLVLATASGLVIAVGEFFGGGIAPMIVGQAAQRIGIEHILRLPIITMAAGFLLCLFLRETRQPDAHRAITAALP